jgi:PD-(D/E)XK nuclease superfamily
MSLRAGIEVVSNSEIATFQRCGREHFFAYGLRRARRTYEREALTRGKAIHKAVGEFQRGEPVDYSGLRPDDRALVRGYCAYYGGKDGRDRQIETTQTDKGFQITIGQIQVVGEFDLIGVKRDSGRKAIGEHKTSSEDISPGSSYWRKVANTDRQVSLYLIASKQKGWGQAEVLYDVLGKTKLRQGKNESEEAFEERVLKDIVENPSKYYVRATLVRLEHEHEAHIRDLKGVVHLMQRAREMGPDVPRNTDSCFRWGKPCEFFPVCGGGADIMDDRLFEPKKSSRAREAPETVSAREAPRKYAF